MRVWGSGFRVEGLGFRVIYWTLQGLLLYKGYTRDNGKENGNYCNSIFGHNGHAGLVTFTEDLWSFVGLSPCMGFHACLEEGALNLSLSLLCRAGP